MSQITTFALVAVLGILGAQFLGGAVVSGDAVASVDREAVPFDNSGSLVDEAATASGFVVDVEVSHNGTELVEGRDYAWNATAGELSRLNSSSVPEGEDVAVSYQYFTRNEETKASDSILSTVVGVIPVFLLAIAALYVAGRVL
jgi:hypothetical protein